MRVCTPLDRLLQQESQLITMPTAYVTGGASGLGKATAQMLVKNGYGSIVAGLTPC
jgi:NADP-dependent 3-hydroxy acid dehydrogenase YdfG